MSTTITKYSINAGSFPKRCGCGIFWDEAEWRNRPCDGIMEGHFEGVRYADDLELRRCTCGSTLAVKIDGAGPDAEMTRLEAIMEIRRMTHEHIEGRMTLVEKERRIRDIIGRCPELPLELDR